MNDSSMNLTDGTLTFVLPKHFDKSTSAMLAHDPKPANASVIALPSESFKLLKWCRIWNFPFVQDEIVATASPSFATANAASSCLLDALDALTRSFVGMLL